MNRQTTPMTMMKNERQASVVNMALRISVKLAINGCRCSEGNCDMACISPVEIKLLKNRPGITAKSRQMPPVRPKEIQIYLVEGWGCPINSLSASMANSGMVNSAMTRMEATVRNLAYMGM